MAIPQHYQMYTAFLQILSDEEIHGLNEIKTTIWQMIYWKESVQSVLFGLRKWWLFFLRKWDIVVKRMDQVSLQKHLEMKV